jgi:hypothetical protein
MIRRLYNLIFPYVWICLGTITSQNVSTKEEQEVNKLDYLLLNITRAQRYFVSESGHVGRTSKYCLCIFCFYEFGSV